MGPGSDVDQFLDLGSGVPTVGNVHEIALALRAAARVAYVDFEPVAVHHARQITAGIDGVTVVQGDLRQPEEVLRDPDLTALLDFDRPVAVLAIAVLLHRRRPAHDLRPVPGRAVPGQRPRAQPRQRRPGRSVLAEAVREIQRGYRGAATPVVLRDRAQIREILDGFEPVSPGLVDSVHWPVEQPGAEPIGAYAAVARAPQAR